MTKGAPCVICPIDFSEPSRSALCYAATIADHFGARLVVLAVDDPLLTEMAATTGRVPSLRLGTHAELTRFYNETLTRAGTGAKTVEFRVAVGKPATEILREAQEQHADLIVLSSHGRSGLRKMFFGSTTERVLRETSVPVLVTPASQRPTGGLSEIAAQIGRVIAPVDLTESSRHQLAVAIGLAGGLSVPVIVAHVLEPVFVPHDVRLAIPGAEGARRAHIEEQLSDVVSSLTPRVQVESIVVTGEPTEEIIKLAEVRQANLIVMGLHSSGFLGPRMGSVTYRVLCLTHALVLAIPPRASAPERREARAASVGAVRDSADQ